MSKTFFNWFIFIVLSFVWGSSFSLMKIGLEHLSPYQVAALRIVFSGLILLPITIGSIRKIPKNKIGIIFLSGVLGSLLPAFLFCIAEEGIDSALAGTLNSLTPIFVILTGAVFMAAKLHVIRLLGLSYHFQVVFYYYSAKAKYPATSILFIYLLWYWLHFFMGLM
ncbi:MAG: DMT family transporter [Chitinophagaceae bacterium]|nr:DMT family transporter [Chitinophagaceae bacterium]